MADKEATVFIVDVGKSMGERHGGRDVTDLDWAMQYVWDKITTLVATGRKTVYAGVVALSTDGADNDLAADESYHHISVRQPISQILMPNIRDLHNAIRSSNNDSGDAISALVVAIQMIEKHCKKLKYKRQIVLVTNGASHIEADETIDGIVQKIRAENIALLILGVDFDDPEYGFKEENKSPTKAENERILSKLAEDCDGLYGTMAQAIEQMETPRMKAIRSVATYRGLLTLGNPAEYDSAMSIDIERYAKVMVARAPTASKFVVSDNMAPGESTSQANGRADGDAMDVDEDGLTAVRQARSYQVDDPDAPNGKKEVAMEDLARGFEYGRTAVPISESDMNVVNLETKPCMDIVGFVDARQYEQYFNMSKSNTIVASKVNDKAKMALSSLIHALHELECYAVARFVPKENHKPLLLLLAPAIEADYECLVDVELPFAEDIRQYTFPPLDKVVTVAGKNLLQHRNLPNDDLMSSMGDYIDAMDLSRSGEDDEGKPTEYAKMSDTYSPLLHRVNQVIRFRAVHPSETLPEPPGILLKYSEPPENALMKAKPALQKVIQAADVKKVPPRQKGRRSGERRQTEKPLSGLDVDALLGGEKRTKISSENAIPEFKQILATTEDMSAVSDAAQQIGKIIEGYIRDSTGESRYGMALEAIRVFKEEMKEYEEPGLFNDFMRSLKAQILGGELGVGREVMWFRIRSNRLGLLDKGTCPVSDVTEEEAKTFLYPR